MKTPIGEKCMVIYTDGAKTANYPYKKTVFLQLCYRRRGRWGVLFADQLQFLFVFNGFDIVHATQLVELTQSETTFAQVSQSGLTVVLREILIGFRFFFEKFVQYHADIYTAGLPAAAPAAGNTPPGAAAATPASMAGVPPATGSI